MIPEAAVEAAIYAYGVDGRAHEWERKMILNILEAAAPYMRQAFFLEMNLKAITEELAAPPMQRKESK